MKRSIQSVISSYRFLVVLAVISLSTYTELIAGDVYFGGISLRSTFYIEDEESIDMTFNNDEDYDVTNFSIDLKISYLSAASTWDIVYEWSKEDLTVEKNSTLEVTTAPDTWSPVISGKYKLSIDTYSPVDIDLSNNSLEKEFLVGNFHKISLKQFSLSQPVEQENSTLGAIGFKLPPNDVTRFINVVAKMPESSSEDYWLVQNLPVLPFLDTRTTYYYFDYSKLGYNAGELIEDLDIDVKESEIELSAKWDAWGYLNKKVWNLEYAIGEEEEEENEVVHHSILDELGDLPVPLWGDVYSLDYEYIGCEMPNIQLDSSTYGVSDDYAGDLNACAPASAANSMEWFENTIEGFPETGLSHREKLEEMSRLMSREDGKGVTSTKFIAGKLAYIDKYKLPVRVTYQSWWDQGDSIASPDTTYGHSAKNLADSVNVQKAPKWEYLKEQVKKGCDVELSFGWYDNAAVRHGGHRVVVTGISETNYAKGVYIKDDWDQKDSTRAIGETFLNWEHNEAGTWGRLVGFDGPNNNCWVESVVSECYDTTVKFVPLGEEPGEEPTGIFSNKETSLVTDIKLLNNPAAQGESASLSFSLDRASDFDVNIYSIHGKLVANRSAGNLSRGQHIEILPGNLFPGPGSYYVVIKLDHESHMLKLIRY